MTEEVKNYQTDIVHPEVSVIVLTYNQEDSISFTLDSILEQEVTFPYEIIIGEDCSTDSTREICEKYARIYPHIVTLLPKAPNKGVVKNYFDAFRSCKGKYIADCAGDDRWSDNTKLQTQYDYLSKNQNISIYITAWTNVADGKPVEYGYHYDQYQDGVIKGRKMLEDFLAHKIPIVLSTALYRKDILEKVLMKYPEWVENEEFGCEDLPVTSALLDNGDCVVSSKSTLDYTVGNPESVTAPGGNMKTFNFHYRSLKATLRLADHYSIDRMQLQAFIKEQIRYLLSIAWHLHKRELTGKVKELVKEYNLNCDLKSRFFMTIFS